MAPRVETILLWASLSFTPFERMRRPTVAKFVKVISVFHEPNPEARDFRSDDPPYPGEDELRCKQEWLKLSPELRRHLSASTPLALAELRVQEARA